MTYVHKNPHSPNLELFCFLLAKMTTVGPGLERKFETVTNA